MEVRGAVSHPRTVQWGPPARRCAMYTHLFALDLSEFERLFTGKAASVKDPFSCLVL